MGFPRVRVGRRAAVGCALAGAFLFGNVRGGAQPELPTAVSHGGRLVAVAFVPTRIAPRPDLAAVALEDREREAAGLPPRFAVPHAVALTPRDAGLWETVDAQISVWRLRIGSPGAVSLNLGFSRYSMPPGGRLLIYSADMTHVLPPFDAADNEAHGELWTPIVPADEIVLEVTLPTAARDALDLKLQSINVGYRGFGESVLSGACNVDVVCPDGDLWRDEIASVGAISTGGSVYCSGFMVNSTALDRRPLFITARHCGITSTTAASLVVYWNFQASTCGGPRDGALTQFQSGSFHRSAHTPSDVTLVELDQDPAPQWGVTFAGWDRSGSDTTSAVAVHHPSGDEKAISFENQATTTTTYLGTSSPGDGTHLRVADWDLGTTEGGSSGSPLFDPQHRVVGQLHGGYAACGNNSADWYGKLSVSWTGGGTSATRLSDWLDPSGTGAMVLDTLDGAGCDADGVCEAGEDCLSCPTDCISDKSIAVCGDAVCHTADGEDCSTCPADCNAETGGPASGRFCCGLDADCADPRCTADGNSCSAGPPPLLYCCGDTVCEGAESSANCAIDCGVPPGCGDAVCDAGAGETPCSCAADCGPPPGVESGFTCLDGLDNDCDEGVDCEDLDCAGSAPDGDGDGSRRCQDCDDVDPAVWSTPGEVGGLTLEPDGTLYWSSVVDSGAEAWTYDLLRSTDPSDFLVADCVASDVALSSAADSTVPPPGTLLAYLVRAVNACPLVGVGSLGSSSSGVPRAAAACPVDQGQATPLRGMPSGSLPSVPAPHAFSARTR